MIRKPLGRWSAAANAVFFFPRLMRCPRRRASVAATPLARSVMATRADPEKLPAPKRAPAEPRAASPAFEPPLLPAAITESTRRILWIVDIYRASCGAVLLSVALLLEPAALNIATPHAFVTATGLYFIFGVAAYWWIQQDRLPMPLSQVLFAMLVGDVFFLALVMISAGGTGAPLPILLFPPLAASGRLQRTRTGLFHAALATVVL